MRENPAAELAAHDNGPLNPDVISVVTVWSPVLPQARKQRAVKDGGKRGACIMATKQSSTEEKVFLFAVR